MAGGSDPRAVGGPASGDSSVLPFRTEISGIAGRLGRLGHVVDQVLQAHAYPEAVGRVLGEALTLTALLGNPLKSGGRLILQTRTNGPIGLLVVNYDAPGRLRGYASFDEGRVAASGGATSSGALLGTGTLAMTIDPGGEQQSYQGIVALDGGSLVDAAHTYFRRSEQLPTFIRVAVGRELVGADAMGSAAWRWRAGGLIVQHVPKEGGIRSERVSEGDPLDGEDDDNWVRVRLLAETVEDAELIDPLLPPERLLLRLFHEEGVRVTPATALEARCRCSEQRIATFLETLGKPELDEMREADGRISVTCEFCSKRYRLAGAAADR